MKQLEFSKNTLQGTFWGIINKFVAVIMPFIVRTILIRRLGAEYAGLNSLFTSILQVLSLAELGFASAMVYEMYKPIAENDLQSLSVLLKFYRTIYRIIGYIVILIGMCVCPFLHYLINGDTPDNINLYILYFIYLTNTAISYFAFAYRASIMSAYQREADNAKIQLITNSVMYAVQIFSLVLFRNYYVYIIFLPVFTLIYNFLRYIYVLKKYPHIKCEGNITNAAKLNIKKNISALFLHKVGNVTVNTLDNIVISSFMGLIILSNYNNYYYVISAVTSILLIFFHSITAGVGNRLIVTDTKKNIEDFFFIFYLNGFFVCLCTSCLFCCFQDFIKLWVGKEYLFPDFTMILFCIYFFVHTIRRTIISYRDAAGMWIDNKWQPIVSAIFNLSLNILLIQIIGINGVAISTILSMIIIDIPWETGKLIHNLFHITTTKYYLKLVLYVFITLVSCIASGFICSIIRIDFVLLRFLVCGIVGFFSCLILFFLFTHKTKEYCFFRNYIGKTLFKKLIHTQN